MPCHISLFFFHISNIQIFCIYVYMAVSLIKTNRAYDILKNYNGENPYMLFLYKKVYVDRDANAMNEANVNFIM